MVRITLLATIALGLQVQPAWLRTPHTGSNWRSVGVPPVMR